MADLRHMHTSELRSVNRTHVAEQARSAEEASSLQDQIAELRELTEENLLAVDEAHKLLHLCLHGKVATA